MPLYDFHCRRCEERFEEIVRNREQAAKVTCPGCGSDEVDKLPSGFATRARGCGPADAGSCSPRGGFT